MVVQAIRTEQIGSNYQVSRGGFTLYSRRHMVDGFATTLCATYLNSVKLFHRLHRSKGGRKEGSYENTISSMQAVSIPVLLPFVRIFDCRFRNNDLFMLCYFRIHQLYISFY